MGWQAAAVFLWINGYDLDAPEDDAFELVMAVATGKIADVEPIAAALRSWSELQIPPQRLGESD